MCAEVSLKHSGSAGDSVESTMTRTTAWIHFCQVAGGDAIGLGTHIRSVSSDCGNLQGRALLQSGADRAYP